MTAEPIQLDPEPGLTTDTKKGEPTELGSTAHTQDRAQQGPDRAERSSANAAAPPHTAPSLPALGGGDAAAPLSGPDDAQIDDMLSLHKALRRLQGIRSRIAENALTARHEHELIDEWEHKANEADLREQAYWEAKAGAYALRLRRETDGRVKTVTGPHGRIETRELPPVYDWDENTLLPWAETHCFAETRTETRIKWAELKKRLIPHVAGTVRLDDGQEVPGITHRLREPSVEIHTWE